MRTTLTIDDDVLRAVKERARRAGRPVGEVLSDLARHALTGNARDDAGGEPRNGFALLPARGGVVSRDLVDELRDEEGV